MITIEDYQVLITWNLDLKELMGNRDEELGFFRKDCKLLRIPLNYTAGGILNKMNQTLAASDEAQIYQML